MISPTVAGSRVDNDGACREAMLGDAADAVVARIAATLSLKTSEPQMLTTDDVGCLCAHFRHVQRSSNNCNNCILSK